MTDQSVDGPPQRPVGTYVFLALLALLGVAELVAVSLLYQHDFVFECRAALPVGFCAFASEAVLRAVSIMAGLALVVAARPGLLRPVLSVAGADRPLGWVGLQIAGFIWVLAPWSFLNDDVAPATLAFGVFAWVFGAFLATVGMALAFAPFARWCQVFASAWLPLLVVTVGGAFLPDLSSLLEPLWNYAPITNATFNAVFGLLTAVGYPMEIQRADYVIGAEGFMVAVGAQCSGVEGFALITVFLLAFFALFRSALSFPRAFLLIPIGLFLSWVFNVVRISGLISIGIEVSPTLAIDGFHSHAGWLMFSLLSLGLVFTALNVSWFMKSDAVAAAAAPAPAAARGQDDQLDSQILPFIVFMASALLLSTFTELPSLYYPLRAAAMAAVLLIFVRVYSRLEWRLDATAIGVGAVIGVGWLLTAPVQDSSDTALADALAAMSVPMFVLWAVSRVLGTTVLVPVIEELFFRGYLMQRIAGGGADKLRVVVAVAISAGLFAALHDRWLAAGIAGILFGLVTLRSGRLSDAIICHGVANAIIAGYALLRQDWAVI